jgi:hypothetical protein
MICHGNARKLGLEIPCENPMISRGHKACDMSDRSALWRISDLVFSPRADPEYIGLLCLKNTLMLLARGGIT